MEKKKESKTKVEPKKKAATNKKNTLKKSKTVKNTNNKKSKTKQKRAFTLIELLAVIIILGILMIIAIPSVTTYISDSRKNSYIDTAKNIIGATRNLVNSGKLKMYDPSITYYVPISCIKTENGAKTPYGEFSEAYVGVVFDGNGYDYYWISNDTSGQGVKDITPLKDLNEEKIVSGITNTEIIEKVSKTGVNSREKILLLNDDCNSWGDEKNATSSLNGNGEIVLIAKMEVGKYVTLVPDSTSYTIPTSITGYTTSQTINPSELTTWKIIGKNSDGTIDMVSEYVSSSNVTFSGTVGFSKYINGLQTIASQYKKSGYTVRERIMGYDNQTPIIENTYYFDGSTNREYTKFETPIITSGVGEEYENGLLGDNLYIKDYLLVVNAYKDDSNHGSSKLVAYRVGTNTAADYWISSRHAFLPMAQGFYYGMFYVKSIGRLSTGPLVQYDKNDRRWNYYNKSYAIRPIITLKSSISIANGEGTLDNPYTLE